MNKMSEEKELFMRALRKLGDLDDDQLRVFMETDFSKPQYPIKGFIIEPKPVKIKRSVGYMEMNIIENLCFLAEKANSEFNTIENRKSNIGSVLEKEITQLLENSNFVVTFTLNAEPKCDTLELIINTKPLITESIESEEFNTTKITLKPIEN